MKFCTVHWEALRAAIDERGLTALVPDSGEQAASNLLSAQADGVTIDNFDPLMTAHNAIMSNALTSAGQVMRLLASDDCPLCFCNREDPANVARRVHDYDVWIGMAADEALAKWKALG